MQQRRLNILLTCLISLTGWSSAARTTAVQKIDPIDPQINFFDGSGVNQECRSKLEKRVFGYSGILISHQGFGTSYRPGKNCFLLIVAPVGYRIRIRVLDFNVLGDPHNCRSDTLHVFDHEKSVDALQSGTRPDEDVSPGPILGAFCGRIRNSSELVVSSQNALTLWWHTDATMAHEPAGGDGFRLLWSTFRTPAQTACHTNREFACRDRDCIPVELACNQYADCKDGSDLDRKAQQELKCSNVDDGMISSLTGPTLLLICVAMVSVCACLCITTCFCCRCAKSPAKPVKEQQQSTSATLATTAQLPPFYPPSPPKMPPPCNYSPKRTRGSNGTTSQPSALRHTAAMASRPPQPMPAHLLTDYGNSVDQRHYGGGGGGNGSDYTYVKDDVRRQLL